MITIKLLGGAKKAAGRSCITFNKPLASISEILTFLRENAVESKILNPNNILIAINGADSALLSGNDTLVKTGDIVTIVTVVHGGCFNMLYYMLGTSKEKQIHEYFYLNSSSVRI